MTKITSYRDLITWQKAMDLVVLAYRESSELPRDERFGLSAQIRRCTVSVPSNIAEGWGRQSTQDYLRFLTISRGSIFELLTQAEICERLGYNGNWERVTSSAEEVGRIPHALIRSIRKSSAPRPPDG